MHISMFQLTWAVLHFSAAVLHFGSGVYHVCRIGLKE